MNRTFRLAAAGALLLAASLLSACADGLTPRQLAAGLSKEYGVAQDVAIDYLQNHDPSPATVEAIQAGDRAALKAVTAVVEAAKLTPAGDTPEAETQEGVAAQSRFQGIYDYASGIVASFFKLVE